jgi:L-lactate dehydrogenase complex protein LldG
MYETFKNRAEGVGAEVHRFTTRREAADFILTFLQQEAVADAPGFAAVWAESPFLDDVDTAELRQVDGLGFEVSRDLAARAKVGISQMQWAVADTGTLVQDQSAVAQRLVSSLPEIHLALVPTGNILGDKKSLFANIDPRASRYLAFVTGPSRTADIERVLTIGVHGPRRLVIVFVDELGGEKR